MRVRDADGGTALQQAVADRARALARGRVPDGVDAGGRRSIAAPARRRGGSASVSRSAARPARPTTSRTRGSSASPRRSSPACGSASTSRRRSARDAYGARYALPIWADFMQRAARVRAPGEFERPGRARRRRRSARSATASPSTAVRSTPSTSRKATRFQTGCARSIAARSASG